VLSFSLVFSEKIEREFVKGSRKEGKKWKRKGARES
jgi:hypothetical protein